MSDLCILAHEKYLANIFNNFLPNRVSVRVSQKTRMVGDTETLPHGRYLNNHLYGSSGGK